MWLDLNEAKLERLDPSIIDCYYHLYSNADYYICSASLKMQRKDFDRPRAGDWSLFERVSPRALVSLLARGKDTAAKVTATHIRLPAGLLGPLP